jgi:hypothetical protein
VTEPSRFPDGSIVITPQDQYRQTTEQFGAITKSLQHIETTLSPIPAQVAEHDIYINTLRAAGLPERFHAVEVEVSRQGQQLAKWAGVFVATSFLAGLAGAFLPRLIG